MNELTPEEAIDARRRLDAIEGNGPGGRVNPAYADARAVASLESDHGMNIPELRREIRRALADHPTLEYVNELERARAYIRRLEKARTMAEKGDGQSEAFHLWHAINNADEIGGWPKRRASILRDGRFFNDSTEGEG